MNTFEKPQNAVPCHRNRQRHALPLESRADPPKGILVWKTRSFTCGPAENTWGLDEVAGRKIRKGNPNRRAPSAQRQLTAHHEPEIRGGS